MEWRGEMKECLVCILKRSKGWERADRSSWVADHQPRSHGIQPIMGRPCTARENRKKRGKKRKKKGDGMVGMVSSLLGGVRL